MTTWAADALAARRLHALLTYDRDTGDFRWRCSHGRMRPGDAAGRINQKNGYIYICIDKRQHLAHRLAWLYVFGTHPVGHIDHINGARGDNSIANLRDVTQAENNQNERCARQTNKAGMLGASTCKQTRKFRSRIVANGVVVHLGYFNTPEQAHAVYVAAKRRLHRGATL